MYSWALVAVLAAPSVEQPATPEPPFSGIPLFLPPTQDHIILKALVPSLSTLTADPAPYRVDPLLHAGIAAGTFGLIGALEFNLKPTLGAGRGCVVPEGGTRCRASDLNGLDRRVVGMQSESWQRISDVTLITVLSSAVVGTTLRAMLSDSPTRGDDLLSDTLVLGEAVGLGVLMTSSLKLVVRRARPANYNDTAPLDGTVDESLSFPSGHTAGVASASFAFATTFWLRHPDSPWRWVFAGSALAATGLTAFSRVAGGSHFPTDVIAGGLFGAGSGILVPLLHSWLGADEVSVGGQKLGLPSVGPIGSTGGQGVFWSSRL
jgi:membrane-associated phospholipid phosphatase